MLNVLEFKEKGGMPLFFIFNLSVDGPTFLDINSVDTMYQQKYFY